MLSPFSATYRVNWIVSEPVSGFTTRICTICPRGKRDLSADPFRINLVALLYFTLGQGAESVPM